jgi:hypothetical protein
MKSYEHDQAKFKRACQSLLKSDYLGAADEARTAYKRTLAQLKGKFIQPKVINLARAAANTVMARWVRELTGITSIHEYQKAQAEAKKQGKTYQVPDNIKAQIRPSNKPKAKMREGQSFSLDDAINNTYKKRVA